MSIADFLAWADREEGRYELLDGEVLPMAPEQVGHARAKWRLLRRLEDAISAAGLPCEAIGDGVGVSIGERTFLVPDAVLRCGDKLPDDATRVTDPLLVVEVISPSNTADELSRKLERYFSLPTLMHVLVVNPPVKSVLHYRRGAETTVLTFAKWDQPLLLDPPGLILRLD